MLLPIPAGPLKLASVYLLVLQPSVDLLLLIPPRVSMLSITPLKLGLPLLSRLDLLLQELHMQHASCIMHHAVWADTHSDTPTQPSITMGPCDGGRQPAE